jgi:hypothetical protein
LQFGYDLILVPVTQSVDRHGDPLFATSRTGSGGRREKLIFSMKP